MVQRQRRRFLKNNDGGCGCGCGGGGGKERCWTWFTMLHKVLVRTLGGGWDTGPKKIFIQLVFSSEIATVLMYKVLYEEGQYIENSQDFRTPDATKPRNSKILAADTGMNS